MRVIYRLTSPSGRVYIGQTRYFNARMSSYRTKPRPSQRLLCNSLKKYGFDQHKVAVLHTFPDSVSQEAVDAYEVYVIAKHACMNGVRLLNLTKGGGGYSGPARESAANREAIRRATQGENAKCAKLTNQDVIEMRAYYRKGVRWRGVRQIAQLWHVSPRLAYNVVNRITWRHVQ